MRFLDAYGGWLDGGIVDGEPFWHAVARLVVSLVAFVLIVSLLLLAAGSLIF